jgi:hypothetical protein
MPSLLHRSAALGICLSLGACPSSPPPDAGAPRDAAVVDAPVRRNRRLRRRAARNRVRPANGVAAAPAAGSPGEVFDEDPPEAPRVRHNPESGPTLPEDLGPPPATTFDMTQANDGPMGLEPAQVSRALNPLLPRFAACAEFATRDDGSGPRGRVNLRLRVRPDGSPAAARVAGGNGGPEFVLCVRRVAASARFAHFGGPDVFVTWGFDVDG